MERLTQLRQSFLQRVLFKVSKARASEGDLGEVPLSPTKREVEFLEKNLEELSRAHMNVCVHVCVPCVCVCVKCICVVMCAHVCVCRCACVCRCVMCAGVCDVYMCVHV